MKIGVDLDNTLICYDKAFLSGARELELVPQEWEGNKRDIQHYIRDKDGGEAVWRRLQGQVYGKWLHRAELFSGVYRFLWRCKIRGIKVQVISHKTIHGHEDVARIPIRDVALEFLEENRLYSSDSSSLIDKVQFCSTRQEKLAQISTGGYDYFIDDLIAIFSSKCFPGQTRKLLFDPGYDGQSEIDYAVSSWQQIEQEMFSQWDPIELLSIAQEITGRKATRSVWIGGRGNSGVARVVMIDNSEIAIKIYPGDEQHDRLGSEYFGYALMRDGGISNLPRPVGYCLDRKVAAYTWIYGKAIDSPTEGYIDSALQFIGELCAISQTDEFQKFPDASAAVFSGYSLEKQIFDRIELLQERSIKCKSLERYIEEELIPTVNEVIKNSRSTWSGDLDYFESLPRKECVLSPSDLGIHNALRERSGKVVFLDFEYFGWDDPAKLIGDFLLHPAMTLSSVLARKWISGAKTIFGQTVIERMALIGPMLQLCWCLILLNGYRKDINYRHRLANQVVAEHSTNQLERQLHRSKARLTRLRMGGWQFPHTETFT